MADQQILDVLRRLYPSRDARGFNCLDYLYTEGSPAVALLYARLLWPQFVEFEGMHFLKDTLEDGDDRSRVTKALRTYKEDRVRVEQSFNCHDFESLFGAQAGQVTTDEARYLAGMLRDTWEAKLSRDWPQKRFRVEVTTSEPTDESVAVMFWRDRD